MPISELVNVAEPEAAPQAISCLRICDEYAAEAKRIQASLVPAKGLLFPSLEIAFRFIPFTEVGGDFVDFFSLPDGIVGIYLGDVVGKGLPRRCMARW